MNLMKKRGKGQISLLILAGMLSAGLYPSAVRADSTEEILDLLKAKNIITADEAAQILTRHQKEEAQKAQAQEQAQAPPSSQPKPITIVVPKGQQYIPATSGPVSHDIKEEVSRQVKQELRDEIAMEVQKENAASSSLDWSKRIHFDGDVRLRYEGDFFDSSNSSPVNVTNPSEVLNRTVDQNKFRYRVRVSATGEVSDQVEAVVRLSTGNTGTPVSTNDTLGNYMNKDNVVFDLAYLKWTPLSGSSAMVSNLDFWGGRIPNPFFSTDLVWAPDLNFEGAATNMTIPLNNRWKGFINAGVFPLQEITEATENKWFFGGQMGMQYSSPQKNTFKLAAAYYDFQNTQGKQNPYVVNNVGPYDYTLPLYQQQGNTVFNINAYNSGPTKFGLAADYHELNITGRADIHNFDPVTVSFVGDYVKNVGFDSATVNALTGENVPKQDTGYQFGVIVGNPTMQKLWDWQTSLYYKYLEADAVLDAFTDPDFHLGGTNAKGWILGGQLGLAKNVWLGARWYSTNVISGPTCSVDMLQVDINARF
jgi:hypothetical protein